MVRKTSSGHSAGGYQSLATIGETSIARIEWPNEAYVPFVEVGVGINLHSHTTLQEEKDFSTALQLFVNVALICW